MFNESHNRVICTQNTRNSTCIHTAHCNRKNRVYNANNLSQRQDTQIKAVAPHSVQCRHTPVSLAQLEEVGTAARFSNDDTKQGREASGKDQPPNLQTKGGIGEVWFLSFTEETPRIVFKEASKELQKRGFQHYRASPIYRSLQWYFRGIDDLIELIWSLDGVLFIVISHIIQMIAFPLVLVHHLLIPWRHHVIALPSKYLPTSLAILAK